ncbi:MAG: pro-sigmaK processing inhibitor BofA family protein [Peptococcaceae bacterium]|jgi:inhibitor of the pro-sigma K processing machinery|nr:pro-sigmaK processing inhibitor BofA family protein [Peptococcaceae bacterium]
MEAGVILAGVLLLIILLTVTRLVLGPVKAVARFMVRCGAGLLVLLVLNALGRWIGFQLPVNPVSVAGVGLLGAPGLVLLSVMSYLLG